jgi:methyl-accepting chemotaxis protein
MVRALGISGRLYALALLITLALVGLGAYALVKLREVSQGADVIGNMTAVQLRRMASLELNVTRSSLQLRHAILARNPGELDATLADIADKRKAIDQTLADYQNALYTERGRELFRPVPDQAAAFWREATANLGLIRGGLKAEAFAFLVDRTIPARNALLATLAETVKFQEKALVDRLHVIEANADQTLAWLLGLVVCTVLALLVFAWHVARVLRSRVAQAQSVADRVSAGDLTHAVQDRQRDEFTPLLAALAQMQGSLVRVVGTVRSNADQVAMASSQIAQGNQDLSSRTEEQASALQQTAATMDQLASTVRSNADNARQANQMALSASEVARSGGAVVGEVVQTMKSIDDSSQRIADIIGVIDGIAFQTNILALNAAVEAARAGEQGRGFAVVAGEVRNLAQRSGEAAREIKQLITTSVERVQKGSELVTQAGSTMQEIVNAIQRVTDIAGEIASASSEQSEGVGQVGQAVQQMDQATQQNSALVEESAAAAEHLRKQAEDLVRAVAAFRLDAAQA